MDATYPSPPRATLFRKVIWLAVFVCLFAGSAAAQLIDGIRVFRSTGATAGEIHFYIEVAGRNFPAAADLRVFVAPQTGVRGPLEVVSATDSLIVVRFRATSGYLPASVGIAGPGNAAVTFDVPGAQAGASDAPRIDDVEILLMDRVRGQARIKVDGAGFGNDKNKIQLVVVPRNPRFVVTEPLPATLTGTSPCPARSGIGPTVNDATDSVLVADFTFPCDKSYSRPFRIARVILSIKKTPPGGTEQSYSASYELIPQRDKNLVYRYSILSTIQAKARFGRGIADNFYVIQLSIVNHGTAKMQVPLAAIQAEAEWTIGSDNKTKPPTVFEEGPPTVSPVPLAAAISFFSRDRKATGFRARFFNFLQSLTTIGSAIQLFFGPGFAQGVGILGGGFRDGLQQVVPDMSDEQLANLTAQSFQSLEPISENGGSLEKVIFIQRGSEVLEVYNKKVLKSRRLITSILGLEITGYQVPDSPAVTATPPQP